MKQVKSSIYLFALLCWGMTLAGCSSEEELTDTNKPGTMVMYATTSFGNSNTPNSRMSYDDDGTGMKIAWSAGDAFSVFTPDATKHDFTIGKPKDGSTYTADETFECEGFPDNLTNGTILDAIYPKLSGSNSSAPGNITLSIAAQAQTGSTTTHLSQCDYMTAHTKYSTVTPKTIDFQFKDAGDGNSGRLGSIYRVALQSLPKDVTSVSKIEISATNASGESSLVTEMGVNFTNGTTAALPKTMGTVTLTVTDGTATIADGKASFNGYMVLFPSYVKEIKVVATTDIGVFTKTKTYDSEVIYTRGQFKFLNMDMSDATIDVSSYTKYDDKGTGTEANPYLIMNATQLSNLATQNNAASIAENTYFKLLHDIDLSGEEWTPIGTNGQPFKGHFDGNGHSVTGITITKDITYTGLFGYTAAGSSIKNLSVAGSITNNSTTSGRFAGGLVGYNSGTITACSSTVTVTADGMKAQVGGLVGNNRNGTITACHATGTVTATDANANAGGLVGKNNGGNILACYSTGAVTANGTSAMVGGLAGNNTGKIYACYATGTVTGDDANTNVGSLVGNANGDIWYCLTTGSKGTAKANENIMGVVNGAITGVGYRQSGEIKSCHGGDDITATLNTDATTTGTGFGMLNAGISQIENNLSVTCPYHWVAGSNIPVLASDAP